MRKTLRNVIVVSVLAAAVLLFMGSCQTGGASDKKTGAETQGEGIPTEEINISYDQESGQWEIPTVTVFRTHRVKINAEEHTVWLLFPGDFDYVMGDGTYCQTEDLLAVMIDRGGSAVIEVPKYFPDIENQKTIRYSVMFRDGDGMKWGDWDYAHGPNTPPGMIIPPGLPH